MASLSKLAIRGIRSFDDKSISIIEFFTPVTVIVGHNGSGKTTIIECLKYATTGDQPPNSRGGAFIHDPKMANEKEVKAQVKLRFHAANGTRMMVVRNLSVTVKKTTGLTMKTLESILAVTDGESERGGKRGVISTKCAEMDAEIPHLLGVSKSVLENVIFCHQEESYWPLAEPSALKKKFDDIFEATRYTKALEAIKALRKDRVADLKTEQERLASLSKEKATADKLRARISDLNAAIAAKEIEYEETKKAYKLLVDANQKFYEWSSKFREMYVKVNALEEKKARLEEELRDAMENLQEIEGTDEELQQRLQNFDDHLASQRDRRRQHQSKKHDMDDELSSLRTAHMELVTEQGALAGEAKAQERRMADREEVIRAISSKLHIKGFDHSPLERNEIVDFMVKLEDMQKRQKAEYEKHQAESRTRNDDYNKRSQLLHTEVERYKLQKAALREQISSRQSSISSAELQLSETHELPGELRTLQADIEDRKARLEKLKADVKTANYEERLTERTIKGRKMDDKREELNTEIRTLGLQADARAKLALKTTELKAKNAEVKNIVESHSSRFRVLVGVEASPDSMEQDLDQALLVKERENAELESEAASANQALHRAETTVSNLKTQVQSKRDELKALERKLKDALSDSEIASLEAAIVDATEQLNIIKSELGNMEGSSQVYEKLLKFGKEKHVCNACTRHMDDRELAVFERHLKEQIRKGSSDAKARAQEEEAEWTQELARLQLLTPLEVSKNRIQRADLPALEDQVMNLDTSIPAMSEHAEEIRERLAELRKTMKDMSVMKQAANHVSRTQKDISRLRDEISSIEKELAATGSTRTADDVQLELDALSVEIRSNEREKQSLTAERDRQSSVMRTVENDVSDMRLRENIIANRIREKTLLEERIESMRREITDGTAKLKELDAKSAEGQAPIEALEAEHQQTLRDLQAKIAEAHRASQEINIGVDKLLGINKAIERYVKEKGTRRLQECGEKIDEHQARIGELALAIEQARDAIALIDKEINEGGASVANLRENIRVRKLVRDVKSTQAEIDSHDMEEAAKARRTFAERYQVEKDKETEMQSSHARIGGELSSQKAQLRQFEEDLREYKDINKRYTDQLVTVKMSDMANSDLEKYAKALENAIMKYHSLKMEEVNDTMRHLWNKTYQGSDIDGIKIRSDVEGGASKRSYNYRVVMTKDQVEMDMRGRCSAGQKMLASIIIRLALSDSFGQNCGILALDEPTNALDTENIDALAASLVEIIQERRNHSNFQLIIITHDENFLRRLGQADVMEHYWRVSRDTRQKSIIVKQRVR